jgi:hypothetical protein
VLLQSVFFFSNAGQGQPALSAELLALVLKPIGAM